MEIHVDAIKNTKLLENKSWLLCTSFYFTPLCKKKTLRQQNGFEFWNQFRRSSLMKKYTAKGF